MSEELKPCPFCGGEAEFEEVGDYFEVTCRDCSATPFQSYTMCHDEAVELWNTRHKPEPPVSKKDIDDAIAMVDSVKFDVDVQRILACDETRIYDCNKAIKNFETIKTALEHFAEVSDER